MTIMTPEELRQARLDREAMTKKELIIEAEKRNLPIVKSMSKFQLQTAIFHHDNFITTAKMMGVYKGEE